MKDKDSRKTSFSMPTYLFGRTVVSFSSLDGKWQFIIDLSFFFFTNFHLSFWVKINNVHLIDINNIESRLVKHFKSNL